jgi:hypothetical protein
MRPQAIAVKPSWHPAGSVALQRPPADSPSCPLGHIDERKMRVRIFGTCLYVVAEVGCPIVDSAVVIHIVGMLNERLCSGHIWQGFQQVACAENPILYPTKNKGIDYSLDTGDLQAYAALDRCLCRPGSTAGSSAGAGEMPAEQALDAGQGPAGRRDGLLLAGELEQQGTTQIHRRQLSHPRPGGRRPAGRLAAPFPGAVPFGSPVP